MKALENPNDMAIGTLAERSGVNIPTIRYYEEIGLIPPAQRRPSGHRVYGQAELERVSFIHNCRDLGFSIDQVRALMVLGQDAERDRVAARAAARMHLEMVRAKLTELRRLEHGLSKFISSCTSAAAGGPAPHCTILKDLGHAPVPLSSPADAGRKAAYRVISLEDAGHRRSPG